MHILQGMEMVAKNEVLLERPLHPIELAARAYRMPELMRAAVSEDFG
jgi:hypothetical protein